MLILTFEDDEEDLLRNILSITDNGLNTVQYLGAAKEVLSFRGLKIDVSNRVVCRGRKEVKITFLEFEILHLLARNPGKVFSKEQIYDIVWKEPYSGDYNIVMSHIRNIRGKIEDNPSRPVYIQTVWGVGYRFNQNISSSP